MDVTRGDKIKQCKTGRSNSYSKDFKFKRDPMTKSESLFYHAKIRCKERCNITLTEEKYNWILKAIKGETVDGIEVKFKNNQSRRVKIYSIYFIHKKEMFDIVFDCERKSIVTFLPHDGMPLIHHYYNFFNTKINLRAEYGYHLKFDSGNLYTTSNIDVIKKVDVDKWFIESFNTVVQMINGELHEIIYNGEI